MDSTNPNMPPTNNDQQPNFTSAFSQYQLHPQILQMKSTHPNMPPTNNNQQPNFSGAFSQYFSGAFHPLGPNDVHAYPFHPFSSTETVTPPFCTQESLEGININVSPSNNPQKKKCESWSKDEDELLMSAWVTISTDSKTGNDQQGKDFWSRITQYYNEFRKSFPPRTQKKVKGHWYQITPSINEFNQIFINIEKQYHSGWSDDQVKDAARKLYYSTYKKSFRYEHAWVILKDEPKWKGGSADDVHTKRRKTSSSSYSTSSDAQTSINIEDDETELRPMGKKKAIRKEKEKATTSSNQSDSIRDLINETNTLRMSSINEVSGYLKDMRDSFKSSKRIEEIKILSQNTENMTYEQLGYHQMLCDEIKAKYGL